MLTMNDIALSNTIADRADKYCQYRTLYFIVLRRGHRPYLYCSTKQNKKNSFDIKSWSWIQKTPSSIFVIIYCKNIQPHVAILHVNFHIEACMGLEVTGHWLTKCRKKYTSFFSKSYFGYVLSHNVHTYIILQLIASSTIQFLFYAILTKKVK